MAPLGDVARDALVDARLAARADAPRAQLERGGRAAARADLDLEGALGFAAALAREVDPALHDLARLGGDELMPAHVGDRRRCDADEVDRGLIREPDTAMLVDDEDEVG